MERKVEILGYVKGNGLKGTNLNPIQLIELAGRTCYKSYKRITDDSAGKFTETVLRTGHESVIEHSWLSLLITVSPENLLAILLDNNLFQVSQLNGQDNFLLSGNVRMFRDYFRKKNEIFKDRVIKSILFEMLIKNKIWAILFEDLTNLGHLVENYHSSSKTAFTIDFAPKEEIFKNNTDLQLKHWWVCVRFRGCSRAFTHQLVRHRLTAVSQESQRYCDESGFFDDDYFVIPTTVCDRRLIGWYEEKLREIDRWYKELQKLLRNAKEQNTKETNKAKVNEDARFLLPNAVCSEIVISCSLEEWRHIFKMRCAIHAQWEIRGAMIDLLVQFQKLFPGLFDNFVIAEDGESATLLV